MAKKADIVKRWETGAPIVLVEYRGGKAEGVEIRDKRNGTVRKACCVRHACEFLGGEQLSVVEWMADGTDPKNVTMPFKRGQILALTLKGYEEDRGVRSASGSFEAVD